MNKALPISLVFILGFFAFLNSNKILAEEEDKEVLYWVAPMDPNYKRDKPGKSPMGMDLVPVYKNEQQTNGNEVVIAPEVVQNLGVRTAIVERSKLWRRINTVGFVDYDESKLSHIHLRTQGWIENLTMQSEGDRVQKGQLLFKLYSPELVNAQEEYLQALTLGNKTLVSASKQRLIALGAPSSEIKRLNKERAARQTISYYAPQDGVVSSLKVREGMYVKPENQIATLADLSTVWVMAEIFEQQSSWVEVGQPAEVQFSYLPGETFKGTVEYVYPSLDQMTRALTVRLKFDNPGEALKPNMFGDVYIFAGAKENIIVVPRESLIRTGTSERVILAKGKGRFEPREVVSGIESGDWIEIQSGLSEGEHVVISGQFLIDSEASTKASFTRMTSLESENDMADKKSMATEIMAVGVVKEIFETEQKLRINHEPIEALGWPQMEMEFKVNKNHSVDSFKLQPGEHITFTLIKVGDRYEISSIKKMEH
jgi:Cu(I)/Ag(I) efflux system membrane fusion protein